MKSHPTFSGKPIHLTVFLGIFAVSALVIYTQRLELLALLAFPLALAMLKNYRTAVIITLWATLIWVIRLPLVFFDFVLFSYVVYFCFAVAIAAYLLRLFSPGARSVPFISNGWLWLFMLTLVLAGIHGAMNVSEIPSWLLTDKADYSRPWGYFRSFVLPGILLLLLALLVAAAFVKGQSLPKILVPVVASIWAIDLLIIGYVTTSGESLLAMAQADQRDVHLTELGFHPNTFGGMLATAYALMLGMWRGAKSPRERTFLVFTLAATAIALVLTFSRGAYLAFAVINVLCFLRGDPRKKVAFVVVVLLLWFVAPAAVFDRVQFGIESKDINEISAGRVENIWLPLLPDVADNIFFGQGLNSIMWTEAQRARLILPVGIAHNGYLDLLLDLGILGALPVLAFYAYLWRGFLRQTRADPDPKLRGLFYGGHLALVSFSLIALTNERLTPGATHCLLWVAAGILLGRLYWKKRYKQRTASADADKVPLQRAEVGKGRPGHAPRIHRGAP